jgi:hypothetical protein
LSEVLLRFLSNRLIDLQGDDAKLEKLREAARDVASTLQANPAKAIAFALVAFDPDVSESDPVVLEVVEALKARWPTHVNTFAGTPVMVVRAILLDSLVAAAEVDDRVAIAFAASVRNVLLRLPVSDERAIWIDVVRSIERKVDARAESEWATPSSITVSEFRLGELPKIEIRQKPAKVNRDALIKAIDAAAGPNTSRGTTSGNPVWPQNNPQQWATEFSDRLTQAVADAADSVAAKTNIGDVDFSKPLLELGDAVSQHVRHMLEAVSAATAGLQRRTNLLWWKEALFSPSAQTSYRDLANTDAAVLMAFDLFQSIPTFSPASVAAFLREAVLCVPSVEEGKTYPLHTLIEAADTGTTLQGLRTAARALAPEPVGRGPILSLIGHSRPTLWTDPRGFRDLVGVAREAPISLPDWALWIFRELQALRAITQAPAPSRDHTESVSA